ncbi:hypothetical protein [Klebsiella phage 05F01]|nr:hypothetical protein [Klebsiella phage 05F01]
MATTFPTYPATTFEQAVELSIFASNQLHNVINGDATTTIETENGDIPSVRKALVDNFFFKTPIRWVSGGTSTVFNQLYYFYDDEVVNGWYYAPSATTENPVSLGSTPVGDDNWVLYTPVSRSTPAEVYPWYVEISQQQTSVSPPYTFDTAIVVYNGVVLTATKDYTITDSVIHFTSPLEIEPDAEYPDILFCYLGKVEEGDPETNYVTYNSLATSTAADIIGTSDGSSVEDRLQSLDNNFETLSTVNISSGSAKLKQVLERTIFDYMTAQDIQTITTSSGAEVNVDYALASAISAGEMSLRIPWAVGIYTSGSNLATLPLGFVLWGNSSRRPYTISSDSSFTGTGITWRTATGAPAPFISTGRHIFRGINFDGRDKTTQLLYSTSSSTQFNGTRFEECGIYRFAVGLGWNNYTGTLFALRCSVSACGDAVKNLIDSSVIGCVMNANNRGIALLTGANNNNFADNRIEWNTTYNIYVYNAIQNIVSGDLIDRAGSAGVVVSGTGSLILSDLVLRRSGASVTLGDNYSSHVHLIDNGEIIINGVKTGSGANDDGTGTISPSFSLTYSGSGTPKVTIAGSDMSGFVTQVENVKLTPSAVIRGNRGINDRITTGNSQVQFLRSCIDMKQSTLAPTVGAKASFSLSIPVDDFSGPVQYGAILERLLKVECRLSTGSYDILDMPLIFRYEAGRSVSQWVGKTVATTTRIGTDSAATGVIVNWSLSSDGTLLTVTLTNVDGIERKSRITLYP